MLCFNTIFQFHAFHDANYELKYLRSSCSLIRILLRLKMWLKGADVLVLNAALQHLRSHCSSWERFQLCAFATYHDDPSRLLCSTHAHDGSHANGCPLEVHPAAGGRKRKRRIAQSPLSAKISPSLFKVLCFCQPQVSHFRCVSSRHLQVWKQQNVQISFANLLNWQWQNPCYEKDPFDHCPLDLLL